MTRDARTEVVDIIIGRGLIAAETISQELRERLLIRLARKHSTLDPTTLLQIARQVLSEFEPALADTLYDAEIGGWLAGIGFVADKLPEPVVSAVGIFGGFGGEPPFAPAGLLWGEPDQPSLRLPMIERAAQILADKRIVSKEQFQQLSAEKRSQAFTVARVNSDATIEKIRDTLVDLVREGPTLRQFKERVAADLETSEIGPGHTELIYRMGVQTAYADGTDSLAMNPVVQQVFTYRAYHAIHDGRVRPEHLALESYGIQGTNIYRSDDQFWEVFRTPWAWNCRCGNTLLTTESAARKGIREAETWLRTGVEPAIESRLAYIPFRPDPDFYRQAA